MARILSSEASLSDRRKTLAREAALIGRIRRYECLLGLVLLAAGLLLWWLRGSTGLLWAAFLLLFLHVGHLLKQRENDRDATLLRIGAEGEHAMAHALAEGFQDDTWVWNDLVVGLGRRQAQIDHLVATPQGLFVVETKNWGGRITGDADAPTWGLQGRRDRHPRTVRNPLHQNRRQAAILRGLLAAHELDWPDVVALVALPAARTEVQVRGDPAGLCRGVDATLEAIRRHVPRRTYTEDDRLKLDALLRRR